jgi:hypothetical protein
MVKAARFAAANVCRQRSGRVFMLRPKRYAIRYE